MKPVVKGAIAVAVLVLAAAVALVPRWQDGGADQGPSADPAVLSAARQEAKLPPCPQPSNPDIEPVPSLEDATATCSADGSNVRLGAALAGQVTLINVWATWCQPCRDELPVLDAYAGRPDSANVLAVQVSSEMVGGLRMLANLDVRIPAVHGGAGDRGPVRAALRVPNTLPASYVVSADGSVHFVKRPRVFHTPEQVRRAVERYSDIEGGDNG